MQRALDLIDATTRIVMSLVAGAIAGLVFGLVAMAILGWLKASHAWVTVGPGRPTWGYYPLHWELALVATLTGALLGLVKGLR
jgi:hypothetical protein